MEITRRNAEGILKIADAFVKQNEQCLRELFIHCQERLRPAEQLRAH